MERSLIDESRIFTLKVDGHLTAVCDEEGYDDEVTENCSAVAYVIPKHLDRQKREQCWQSAVMVRENQLRRNENAGHAYATFTCECGCIFDTQILDSPEYLS